MYPHFLLGRMQPLHGLSMSVHGYIKDTADIAFEQGAEFDDPLAEISGRVRPVETSNVHNFRPLVPGSICARATSALSRLNHRVATGAVL